MPVLNGFLAPYKVIGINTSSALTPQFQWIIAKSYDQDDSMDGSVQTYIQGSPKSKILNIGKTHEDLTIVAPILVGGGSLYDGRNLLNSKLSNIINNSTGISSLPLISGATVHISESESSVTLKLKSDGDPNNSVNAVQISDDASNAGYIAVNDALASVTRVATFYDFKVNLGGFQYYVLDGTINITVETKEEVFLGSALDSSGNTYTTQYADPAYTSNYSNQGLQFPYIGVSAIKITGSGRAAVSMKGTTGQPGFMSTNIKFLSTSTGIAKANLWQNSNVTLQTPGDVITGSGPFTIQVYTGTEWIDLLDGSGISLTNAIVNKQSFKMADLMTASFDFMAYIL